LYPTCLIDFCGTRYTVSTMSCFVFVRSWNPLHLPCPELLDIVFVTLPDQFCNVIVAVPPGLYIDLNFRLVVLVVIVACPAMLLSFAFSLDVVFLACHSVFVSANPHMLTHLVFISCSMSSHLRVPFPMPLTF
jgi:hypothetical protein